MFSEEERAIYEFQVNGQKRSVDPIAVMRVLQTHDDIDLEKDYIIISTIDEEMDKEQSESLTRIIEASRAAFSLPAFSNGEGVLDSEVLEIFTDYYIYLDDLKKKSVTSPISSESMAETSLAVH